jgi:hypothetical protein
MSGAPVLDIGVSVSFVVRRQAGDTTTILGRQSLRLRRDAGGNRTRWNMSANDCKCIRGFKHLKLCEPCRLKAWVEILKKMQR